MPPWGAAYPLVLPGTAKLPGKENVVALLDAAEAAK